jgi:signal transduction histidine kinase
VFRLYQDQRGDVWIGTMSASGLARWDHASGRVEPVGAGWPRGAPTAFTEDRAGALWVGYDNGQLVRWRGGEPQVFGAADGVPPGAVNALLVDRTGRLWLAADRNGVARVDEPSADRPRFVRYGRAQGLASDQAMALVDDERGRLYVGTTRGVDRLDPGTGRIAHFNTADGLPNDFIYCAFRDRTGALWFGTKNGAARLVPGSEGPPARAATFLTGLRVSGAPSPLAAGGEEQAAPLELQHDQDQLDLSFASPRFELGAPALFQVRLTGADRDWSAPMRASEVRYARLAPGAYRFEVRALSVDGAASDPASLPFVILRPLWQRWWFVAACAAAALAVAVQAYRWRVAHVLAVERVRTRIATDLHDDLGANLSRIAILSDLAARRAAEREESTAQVQEIGRSARELVDVASDIVWSTDPRRDDVGSVLVRVRSFAADVLEGRGIAWTLEAPPEPHGIKLEPGQRRHLYLVLKEAILNAARHSRAKRATIAVERRDGWLEVRVSDDGAGFDEAALAGSASRSGNGLANMRARAREASGEVAVRSSQGQGTEILLRLPLRGA